jgi:hypothetical protein
MHNADGQTAGANSSLIAALRLSGTHQLGSPMYELEHR